MGVLRISLFGTVRIRHDSWSSDAKVGPRAQALLAYLLLNGQRNHSREILIEIFWQNRSPSQARNCLSTTLWRIRQALEVNKEQQGAYLLTPAHNEVGFNWNSNHWLDTAVFETSVERLLDTPVAALQPADVQRLQEATQLYTGDLLEGIYDDWAITRQEQLRCLYLDCLEHLMDYYQYRGKNNESLYYGQRILEREPLREKIHRELIRLYLANGQRALAVRQYELCRQTLNDELGLSPMKETDLLYAQALELDPTPHPPPIVLQPQAFEQLGAAMQSLNQAQQQLITALEQFEYSQRLLNQAVQQLERTTSTRSSKHR